MNGLNLNAEGHFIEDRSGRRVYLTLCQEGLANALMRANGGVLNRSALKAAMGAHYIYDQSVNCHIKRLRKKLVEKYGGKGTDYIRTLHGHGYYWACDRVA